MCDLYGFKTNDIGSIAKELESVIGISFELHDSFHRGGDYYLYKLGTPWQEELILQRNAELEDEFAEPDFSEYPVIFYACVRDPSRLMRIREQLSEFMGIFVILLRSES